MKMSNTKKILVTGTSRGIGREILYQILNTKPDYSVIAVQRKPAFDDAILLDKFKSRLYIEYFDITDFNKSRNFIHSLPKAKMTADILINNAGIYSTGFTSEEIFRTNYFASKFISEEFIRTTNTDIKIINISSGMGELRGFSKDAQIKLSSSDLKITELEDLITLYNRNASIGWPPDPYSASKGALNALTRIWARSLPDRITCISVCPGWVKTDMGGDSAPRSVQKGAETPVWAATTDEPQKGFFYRDKKVVHW